MISNDVPVNSLRAGRLYSSIVTNFVPVTPFRTTQDYRSMATTNVHITSFGAYAPNRTTDNKNIRRSIFRNSVTKTSAIYYLTNTHAPSNYEREYNNKGILISKAILAMIITVGCLIAFGIAGVIVWCLCFKHAKKKGRYLFFST